MTTQTIQRAVEAVGAALGVGPIDVLTAYPTLRAEVEKVGVEVHMAIEPAIRQAVADQIRAVLLDGLDQLQRFTTYAYVDPGDVADLIERVTREVGR